MSLLVLAYPKISKKDFKWVQNIRSKHDARYYNIVNPHFTLVFPAEGYKQNEFINDLVGNSLEFKRIKFISRRAVLVKDSISEFTDLFLVPDEGYSDIVKLHDNLYSGILKNSLRFDIPYIPHIGVGGSTNPVEGKSIADELNRSNFTINGILDKLAVINYHYPHVKTLMEIKLK
jgi:2'-5' RNA ligase